MENNNEKKWYGWKDIEVDKSMISEEVIEKGEGSWKKKYQYVYIPKGYGYDNYCFLLSEKCIHVSKEKNGTCYFSVCDDMNLELIYNPKDREENKRYKRYKMTGYELFEFIFKDYEIDFEKEYYERLINEQIKKEKREKKTYGSIVCGKYQGNIYANADNGYYCDDTYKVYFRSEAGTYRNKKFSKVQNVNCGFTIASNVSLYFFNQYEDILNQFVLDYELLLKERIMIEKRMNNLKNYPVVNIYSGKIIEEHYETCLKTIENIKSAIIGYVKEKNINE